MTNIDRAAGFLWIPEPHLSVSECGDQARELAKVLDTVGLLMPDLPKPTDRSVPEWESPSNEHHAVSVERGGTVRIWGDTSGYTPKESRDLALAMLAAANYAERNQE